MNNNYRIICAIEEEAEALAAITAKEQATNQPKGGEQEQKEYEQTVKKQWKFDDAPDGKFEDFVAAEVRRARAASHVANAVLGLCRGGDDDRQPARGISGAGPRIGVNATASISSGIS